MHAPSPSPDERRSGAWRALAWLAGGALLFAVLVILTAPELVFATQEGAGMAVAGDAVFAILLAAVPGLIVLVRAVVRRTRQRSPRDGREG